MTKDEFIRQFHHIRNVVDEPDYPLRKQGKPAAVLIPLVDHGDYLNILFTQRATHLKHHPGQISFPGGRIEDSDKDAFDAALREAEEEIGLSPDKVQTVGALSRYRTISQYEITPIIGFVDPTFEVTEDPNEVETVFELPFAEICDPSRHIVEIINRQGQQYPIYFIPHGDYLIWGATAAIIRNLSNHLHDLN